MKMPISFRNVAITLFVGLTISYLLCILGGVLFDWTMYEAWAPLLPGFTWPLETTGFFIGLLWLVVYSLYIPAVLVLPYNYLTQRLVTSE